MVSEGLGNSSVYQDWIITQGEAEEITPCTDFLVAGGRSMHLNRGTRFLPNEHQRKVSAMLYTNAQSQSARSATKCEIRFCTPWGIKNNKGHGTLLRLKENEFSFTFKLKIGKYGVVKASKL